MIYCSRLGAATMSVFVQLAPAEYSGMAFASFSAGRRAFDLGDARAMMWMSQLAYETDTPSTIDTVGPRWAFKPIQKLRVAAPAMDTRVIVGERADCTIVAFAGTDPALAANLLTDVNVRLSSVNTHSGFQEALDSVWPSILPHIKTSARPLFFTGHSLGAALAVLGAFRAAKDGIDVGAVYTFGMPRAGAKSFADRYNAKLGERTFRLVHGGDTVPCIPDVLVDSGAVGALLAGLQFHHVGRMLKCDSGGKFDRAVALTTTDSNDPRFLAGARENMRHRVSAALAGQLLAAAGPGMLGPFYKLLPFAIRDHLPDRYLRALED
jgi:hypothetical protein